MKVDHTYFYRRGTKFGRMKIRIRYYATGAYRTNFTASFTGKDSIASITWMNLPDLVPEVATIKPILIVAWRHFDITDFTIAYKTILLISHEHIVEYALSYYLHVLPVVTIVLNWIKHEHAFNTLKSVICNENLHYVDRNNKIESFPNK